MSPGVPVGGGISVDPLEHGKSRRLVTLAIECSVANGVGDVVADTDQNQPW